MCVFIRKQTRNRGRGYLNLIFRSKYLGLIFILPFILMAKDYRGAEYRTIEAFTYGRFEVRMHSAAASGMLSSFFTYHEAGSIDEWNEIDIEIMGRYSDEVQFNTITPNQTGHEYEYVSAFNPHREFHVYAIEWTPDYVAWSVDSLEIYRQSGEHITSLNRAQKLMMNIWPPTAVNWAGVLDPTALPLYAKYDWVQYYSYTPEKSEPFTLQWRDDFDSWDQTRWQKATHTFDGNNCDFVKNNAVFQDGYLVLCLTKPEFTGYSGGTIEEMDVTDPYLMQARFFNDQVRLDFSEKMEQSSAQSAVNYIIPGLTVLEARLQPNGRTVLLQTSGRNPELSYNIFVTNVYDRAQPPHPIPVKAKIIQNTVPQTAVINVGGPGAEKYFPGQVFDASQVYGRLGGHQVAHGTGQSFTNTEEDYLYQDEIRGLSGYELLLPNGTYDITLCFAETEHSQAGRRVFSVYQGGREVVSDLDIFKRCGAFNACEVNLPLVNVSDHKLRLYFKPGIGETQLSAIKIDPHLTAIGTTGKVLKEFDMRTWPNPFNPRFHISYRLPRAGTVQLDLVDTMGRRVRQFVNGAQLAGMHHIQVEPQNLSGGLYFCRLILDGRQSLVQKVIYLK